MILKEETIRKIISETIRNYINESKINPTKIVFVAFGNDKFDINKVKPVDTNGIYSS